LHLSTLRRFTGATLVTSMLDPLSSRPWLVGTAAATMLALAAAAYNRRKARITERSHPPVGEFIDAEGVKLHYLRRGSGSSVILIHGNGVMLQDWTVPGVFDGLAASHDVVAFDRPGFGYSKRPRNSVWTPQAQARAIAAALEQPGLSDATVVGHSFGTLVAIALALNHPHLVARLVLLSGYYFPTFRPDILLNAGPAVPGTGDLIRYTFGPPLGRALMPAAERQLFAPGPVDPRWQARFPIEMLVRPSQMRATAEDFAVAIPSAAALSKRYGELEHPITLAAGRGDKIVGYDHAERFHASVPHAKLIRIEEAGHMVHYTATDRILAAIETGAAPDPPAGASATAVPPGDKLIPPMPVPSLVL
jgi:pimeloyl-ACP methyl ester carboxylesterase